MSALIAILAGILLLLLAIAGGTSWPPPRTHWEAKSASVVERAASPEEK